MDAETFKQLFLPLHPRLYRAAHALLGNAEDAEDMVQEAYLKLWHKRDELDIRTNIAAYCIALIRNLCFDLMQTKRYTAEEPLPERMPEMPDADAGQRLEERDEWAHVKQLIARLPRQQRQVLWLRDVEECSMEDIEQATGLSAVNIRSILSRTRKKIREQFNRLTGDLQ